MGTPNCGEIQRAGLWHRSARGNREDQMMKETQTDPLRLPRSLKEAVERLSREDRTSINQFVANVDKTMMRRGGKTPGKGDEMPS